MNKKELALIVVLTASPSITMSAGIPVIDSSNLVQQIIQINHMVSQITELKNQLATAQAHLNAISGSRGLAGMIKSTYDATMAVDPKTFAGSLGLKSGAAHGFSGDLAALYDEGIEGAAAWLEGSQNGLAQQKKRFAELNLLIMKVNNSPDQKDIMDLQARVEAEGVMLGNELTKLTMFEAQAKARQEVLHQKIQQMVIESAHHDIDLTGKITWP